MVVGVPQRRAGALVAVVCAPLLLTWAGCSWFDSKSPDTIKGTRLSVLSGSDAIAIDPSMATTKVRLPRPYRNAEWPQQGGLPTHSNEHLELGDSPVLVWKTSIGA